MLASVQWDFTSSSDFCKTLGKFFTKVSSVAHLELLGCMLTHVHLFWSRLCGDLSGLAGVEAAV